eukprot:1153245-Pelagomonas_calceolata.AAC.4
MVSLLKQWMLKTECIAENSGATQGGLVLLTPLLLLGAKENDTAGALGWGLDATCKEMAAVTRLKFRSEP